MPSQAMKIPFNKPAVVGNEMTYIQEALASGKVSGDGAFTQKVHTLLEEALGVPKVLLTTSCTHALEMAALLLDIQPGDEVIIPSFTFVSTINAFVLRGATPVFADVRPDTLNIDERQLEALITERTRAIVPVHYGGIACEMDTIMDIANRHGVTVIEDNAHGLFGKYKGKYLGTFGAMATQSFHETKNFHCGEGGALLINDEQYMQRAEIIREKGTNRSRFFRGEIDKYTWVDVGSSYLPSDMNAAFLYGQLERREAIQSKREAIWKRYYTHLHDWAEEYSVQLPVVPDSAETAYHLFHLLMPTHTDQEAMLQYLKHEKGYWSVFHYLPLHLSDMGREYGGEVGDCPVTEDVAYRLLRLPFFYELTEAQQMQIIDALHEFDGWDSNST